MTEGLILVSDTLQLQHLEDLHPATPVDRRSLCIIPRRGIVAAGRVVPRRREDAVSGGMGCLEGRRLLRDKKGYDMDKSGVKYDRDPRRPSSGWGEGLRDQGRRVCKVNGRARR